MPDVFSKGKHKIIFVQNEDIEELAFSHCINPQIITVKGGESDLH